MGEMMGERKFNAVIHGVDLCRLNRLMIVTHDGMASPLASSAQNLYVYTKDQRHFGVVLV